MSDINVGQFSEALNDKADRDLQNVTTDVDYVVESKFPTDSDPTWYRLYKSGWCEQGGETEATESTGYTVSLLKQFQSVNYNIQITCKSSGSTGNGWGYAHTKTITNFKVVQTASGAYWEAKGMIGE